MKWSDQVLFKGLILVFVLLLLWPAIHSLTSGNDFDIFIKAAYSLSDVKEIYNHGYVNGLYYYYSPLFIWFLQPFTYFRDVILNNSTFHDISLSLVLVKASWNLLMFFLVYRIIKIINGVFKFESEKSRFVFYLVCFVLCYRWFFLNIWYGQLTIFILWSILESFVNRSENKISRWAPFALAVNVKIIPMLLFGKFVLDKDWKSLKRSLLWLTLFLIIPFIFYPFKYIFEQNIHWLQLINPIQKTHIITIGEGGFIDIGAIVVKYFTNYEIPTEPTICISELSHSAIFAVTQLWRLIVFGLVIWLHIFIRNSKHIYRPDFLSISLFCAAIPVIFPHQRDYSLALLIPAVCYVVYMFTNQLFSMNAIMSAMFFVALELMGCVFFYEIFSLDFRLWVIGVRLQGIGALIFFFCFATFIYRYQAYPDEED